MSLFEPTSRGGSRFGNLSSNMFFTRNTAKPKRVRHIEGLNGALICNVNDDPSLIRSSSSAAVGLNKNNLPLFETPRRVERLVPPTSFWNTYGVLHDTDSWKQELASLATASGLGVEKDDQSHSNKPTATADQHASRSGAFYSRRTGRFNEGAGKSRGRTTSKHGTARGDMLFHVPESERDMWMLQVLCQLLGTSDLQDVQSWLVSASTAEKDRARMMINSALCGLKESERTSDQAQQPVDLNSLSNFVERQKHEEQYASQKYMKDTLNRLSPSLQSIDEEAQTDINTNESTDTVADNKSMSNVSLQTITTYRNAYPNYYQGAHRSLGVTSSYKKNHLSNDDQQTDENGEQIDTIQLDDDRQRPQSGSLKKSKKLPKKSQSLIERPSSSQKSKYPSESVQFNDDGESEYHHQISHGQENKKKLIDDDTDENEHHQIKDDLSSSNKTDPLSHQNDQGRSRKIRVLQQKLSRQEEESKKLFGELQSKQSRLENAIKLLVKQTSLYGKRHQQPSDETEKEKDDLDAPVVNLFIQSPRDHNHKQSKTNSLSNQSEPSAAHGSTKSKKNSNNTNGNKTGDYSIKDVKVQISLSRLDNHSSKVYSGVWKPDVSTIQRLQGN